MNERIHLGLEDVPKELHLILELLKSDNTISNDLFTDIDWDLFIDLTMHHRVFPVLYIKLKEFDKTGRIPSFVTEALSRQYKRNTFQMLHFTVEMVQISKLFLDHNIHLLFIKGPVLGHDLYGDISLRTSGDLDVIIPIDRLEHAEELLQGQGYERDDYIKTVLNDWKWRHHHVTYFHPDKGIKLEIHWRLNPGPAKEPSFSELWERKSLSNVTSQAPIYTLGKEDSFLFLVSHGARHGWSRLRWLLDVHQLLNEELNWKKAYKLLKKNHLHHVAGQSITLASHLLDTKSSIEIKRNLVSKKSKQLAKQAVFYLETMVNLHTDPVPIEISTYHRRHLFSLMSTKQKLFFMLSCLYPYPEDAETLPLPKTLHFLYFPLRPVLWAWRQTRKHAFS